MGRPTPNDTKVSLTKASPKITAINGTTNKKQVTVMEQWDEQQLEAGLRRLKELQIKLQDMRTTIPRMVQPLTTHQQSPETLFQAFAKSVQTANKEVKEFREAITNEQSQKVIKHAEQSRSANPKGIKPWRARDDPDWLTLDT